MKGTALSLEGAIDMDDPDNLDSLFRDAVSAMDAGDVHRARGQLDQIINVAAVQW